MLGGAFVLVLVAAPGHPAALVALLAVGLAVRPVRLVRSGATGRELIAVLKDTGRLELGFAVLLAAGLAV